MLASAPRPVRLAALAACLVASGCGGGGGGGGAGAGAGPWRPAAPLGSICQRPSDAPYPQVVVSTQHPRGPAGPIPDGTYDAVAYFVDEADPPGRGHTGEVRTTLQLQTDQRDARHVEGALVVSYALAPAQDCQVGRFAIVGDRLRFALGSRLEEHAFALTPDGFVIESPRGGTRDVKATVFRRR
jgi:hypothetical protein